jgi:hypothetical protein
MLILFRLETVLISSFDQPIPQFDGTTVEIKGHRDDERMGIIEKDEYIGAPLAVIDYDDWSAYRSTAESVV